MNRRPSVWVEGWGSVVLGTRNSLRLLARRGLAAGLAALCLATASQAVAVTVTPLLPACAGPDLNPARVDLHTPLFSHPLAITNPLFPVSTLVQVVQLGDGRSRNEITLLDRTRVFSWNNQVVETRVVQFIAHEGGRIVETTFDYYARADDGSVWYFGQDVSNYENGVVVNHNGSWLAGRDGPPGMIMPAQPRLGDVFRPETVPGLAFEEVTVLRTGLTVDGPRGPVAGAIEVRECQMDNTVDTKIFAPGYGEFGDGETVALAVPVDSRSGPMPAALEVLSAGAIRIWELSPLGATAAHEIAVNVLVMRRAWERLKAAPPAQPPLLVAQMDGALASLEAAVAAFRGRRQTALHVLQAALDLQLQYRPVAAVDADRIDLWWRQLALDSVARNEAGIRSDLAIISAIRERTGSF
jgi:hypothetical protein